MNFAQKSFLSFLLVIVSLPAMAQVGESRRNFSVGVNGGVNFNSLALTPQRNQSATLMGYAGGVTARYIHEKYFAMICGIQMEVNLSQRGWKEVADKDDTEEVYHRVMNYVEIPILTHLAFGREKGVRFFLNLGPQVAFLLSESESFSDIFETGKEINNERRNFKYAQHNKKADNKFDYGIVGGGGLELRTKAGNFLVEGRYYFGLADIFDNARSADFSRSAHSTILARVTYLFDLKR